VASSATTAVAGTWQRHVSARYAATALDGRSGDGRWGTRGGFAVLYLGQPLDSVVVEAYRHFVDPLVDGVDRDAIVANIAPRILVTAKVSVTDILDLRDRVTRVQLGLSMDVLQSSTEDTDAYAACQGVAQVAHQLGLHGVIAPAATGLGETLALFTGAMPADQQPMRSEPDQLWQHIPADPRRVAVPNLTLVRPISSGRRRRLR